MAKRGTLEHPKNILLAEILKVEIWASLGLLEALWHWACKYAPSGDIGRYSNSAIAEGLRWRKNPNALINALVQAGWLDEAETGSGRLVIHDFSHHADNTHREFMKRNGLIFADGSPARNEQNGRPNRSTNNSTITPPEVITSGYINSTITPPKPHLPIPPLPIPALEKNRNPERDPILTRGSGRKRRRFAIIDPEIPPGQPDDETERLKEKARRDAEAMRNIQASPTAVVGVDLEKSHGEGKGTGGLVKINRFKPEDLSA